MAEESVIIHNKENSCVFKPAIPCAGKSRPEKTVSKIVSQKEATEETKSYELIKHADPNEEYYPGSLEKCIPDENARHNLTACKNMTSKLTLQTKLSELFTTEFSLLQIPDGGFN
jgi:hypothetical protein